MSACLRESTVQTASISIISHLLVSGHKCSSKKAFTMLHNIRNGVEGGKVPFDVHGGITGATQMQAKSI